MHNNATNPQSERSPNTRQRKELSTKTFSGTTFPKTAPLGCVAAQRVPKENAFLAKQQRKTLLVETLLFFKKHNTNTRTCILFVQRHMHTNSHLPPPPCATERSNSCSGKRKHAPNATPWRCRDALPPQPHRIDNRSHVLSREKRFQEKRFQGKRSRMRSSVKPSQQKRFPTIRSPMRSSSRHPQGERSPLEIIA